MSAPLLVAILLLASLAAAGCDSSSERRACAPAEPPADAEALATEALARVCDWQDRARLPDAAIPGAKLFATSGCLACHTYLGDGSRNLGAPDLSTIGRRLKAQFLARYVADPARFGDDVMPKFRALGRTKLRQLSVFLAASKGPRR